MPPVDGLGVLVTEEHTVTLHHAFNVPAGCAMCTGRFVVFATVFSSVLAHMTAGLTNLASSRRAFRNTIRTDAAYNLRVARAGAVYCADARSTHICGEDK